MLRLSCQHMHKLSLWVPAYGTQRNQSCCSGSRRLGQMLLHQPRSHLRACDWTLTGLTLIHVKGQITEKEQLPPSSRATVIERQSSVCLICSNLPMITASPGIYSSTAGDSHLKNVGLALDSNIKDIETGLISIQVSLLAFLCAATEGSPGPWITPFL